MEDLYRRSPPAATRLDENVQVAQPLIAVVTGGNGGVTDVDGARPYLKGSLYRKSAGMREAGVARRGNNV
jgi:hypothetical protein